MILARSNGRIDSSCAAFSHENHPFCERLLSHLIQIRRTVFTKRCRASMLFVIP